MISSAVVVLSWMTLDNQCEGFMPPLVIEVIVGCRDKVN